MVCYTQSYTHPFFTAIPFDIFTIFIIFGISSFVRSLKREKHILGTSAIVNDMMGQYLLESDYRVLPIQ